MAQVTSATRESIEHLLERSLAAWHSLPGVVDRNRPIIGLLQVSGILSACVRQTNTSRGRKAETTKLGTSTSSLSLRSTATLQRA